MRFNSKGALAKFYLSFQPDDKKQLPQDLCTYFWGLVERGLFVLWFGGLLTLFVIGIVKGIIFLSTHKRGAGIVLALIAIVAFAIWLARCIKKKKVKIEALSEAKAIIKDRVDAVKNRYCPRIEWR